MSEKRSYQLNILEAPDFVSTYLLGFEKSLCLALISAYIYNMVAHGIKSSVSDFQRFCRHLQTGLKTEHDPHGLIPSIISICIDQELPVSTSANWCLEYISYYCDIRLEVNLWNIAQKMSNGMSNDQICKMFSEMFKVEVRVVKSGQKTEVYAINSVGRFMVIRILNQSEQFYLPFTNEMNKILDTQADDDMNLSILDMYFNHEPYIVEKEENHELEEEFPYEPLKLDREKKFSIRTPIKYLEIDPEIKKELETEYFSVVKLSESYNQIRAFAYQLTDYLELHPNDEVSLNIKNCLADKKTFCGLTLTKSIKIYQTTHQNIFNICLELMTEAVKNPNHFEEISDYRVEEDQEQGFSTLRVLAKIFGVELCIIFQDNNNFLRAKFPPQSNQYSLEFHFLALKQNLVYLRVYALNTLRQTYLEGFKLANQSKTIKRSLIKDQVQVQNLENKKESQESRLLNLRCEFFESVAITESSILKDYFDCISGGIPCSVTENISENINRLKSLRSELEKHEQNINFDSFQVFSYSEKNCNVTCHICDQAMKSNQKLFYSAEGCGFHFQCMDKWFQQWYNGFEQTTSRLEDVDLPCLKCQKPVSIFSFLKQPDKKEHFSIVKASIDGKVKCCSCNNDISLTEEMKALVAARNPVHCTKCVVKIRYSNMCQTCRFRILDILSPERSGLECDSCRCFTHIDNFAYSETRPDAKCKKCWMREIIDSYSSNQNNFNDIVQSVVGLEPTLNCQRCQMVSFRAIPGKICIGCNIPTCYNCNNLYDCTDCGQNFIDCENY